MIGGPNGSGKSTLAEQVVLLQFGVRRFMNADTIARGLAAFDVTLAAVSAGRALLNEADRLVAAGESFAAETTLSGRAWAKRVADLRQRGYRTHLAFVYLRSADDNVRRVAKRVAEGGHDIPEADIRRRHGRALANLFQVYLPVVETWRIYENSGAIAHKLIVAREEDGSINVADPVEWDRLRSIYAK